MLEKTIAWLKKQVSRSKRLSKLFFEAWKTDGGRQTLARVFKKLYLKLDNTPPPPPIEEIPDPRLDYYRHWAGQNFTREVSWQQMAEAIAALRSQPLISVILPTFNTGEPYLRGAIESVRSGAYHNWELCIADAGSSAPHIRAILEEYAALEPRIKVVFAEEPGNMAAAGNLALDIASGEVVVLLENKDIVTPDALYEVALMLNRHPEADVIYSDEDKVDDADNIQQPLFKQDWNPDTFLFWMEDYQLGAYRRSLVKSLGGFRNGFDRCLDCDLFLRLVEVTSQVFRIPKILYHRRIDSAAAELRQEASKIAIAEAIQRRGARKAGLEFAGNATGELPQLVQYYHQWLRQNFPRADELRSMARAAAALKHKPRISIVMPAYNTPEVYLREAIDSVRNQIYPHWELCIADDASTAEHIKPLLEEYAELDSRIKVVFRAENGHISAASNSAIALATGEFIALLDHDDLLTPDALYQVALLINRHPEVDAIYSDEDKIDEQGMLRDPFFKPEWSPDSFLSRMYVGHLGVYRRSLIQEIGGFRLGYEGSQDYDLVLRLTEKTENIFHIPKILYHWRIHLESAASSAEAKPYAYQAAQKAIAEAINRRGESGEVTNVPGYLGHYIIRYKIAEYKLVSIIIPTRDLGELLNQCLESIFGKSTYPNYEVVVIDNGSTEPETAEVIARWAAKEPNRFRCYPLDIPFNFSKINNYAAGKAEGDYLLFLNNDTEAIAPDWIEAMVEQAQRPSIGAVGGLLLYPDQTIQHAGVILGLGGLAAHSHQYLPSITPGYGGHVISISNVSAVTAACLMCRREVFESVGGFNEELAFAYNDVDLCLKIGDRGYRNIYLPHAVLYHHESRSRGYEDTPAKQERLRQEAEILKSKWPKLIENDPCYSPHLTRGRADYSIRIE